MEKIVIVGSANTDLIVRADRIPSPGETVLGGEFRIVSGGTDNHLMLIDLRPKHATGKAVANALDIAHITANKNMIPFDPEKPFVTSGIRVGTPAITTRGLKEAEMVRVADFIERGVELREDEAALAALGNEVQEFMADFPMPRF